MRRHLKRRTFVFQVLVFAVAFAMSVFVLLRKGDDGSDEAFAAPAAPSAPLGDGGASSSFASDPAYPAAAGSQGSAHPGSPGPEADASVGAFAEAGSDPIDLAVAPQGGVPFHPQGTRHRSPFAKPGAGPPVFVKVGMLVNSVDDYDVKTGRFTADFFFSLTSLTEMPSLSLVFPNGRVD
jgi:hypothetical protein